MKMKIYAELKLRYTTKQNKYFREDLYKHYRIRESDYETLFNQQEGNCGCCNRNQMEFKRRLSVDHCHATKKVRSLLCDNCNPAVGFVKESEEHCLQVLEYIRKFKKAG